MRVFLILLSLLITNAVAFGQRTGGGTGNTGGTGGGTGGAATGSTGTGANTGNTGGATTGQTQPTQATAEALTVDLNQLLDANGVTRGQGIGPSRTTVRGFSIFEAAEGTQQNQANAAGARRTAGGFAGGGVGTGGFGALGGISGSTQTSRLVRSRLQLSSELLPGSSRVAAPNGFTTSYSLDYSPQMNGFRTSVSGKTATISGRAASENEKSLAGRVMLLQPGVDKVNNQAVVGPAPVQIAPSSPY